MLAFMAAADGNFRLRYTSALALKESAHGSPSTSLSIDLKTHS